MLKVHWRRHTQSYYTLQRITVGVWKQRQTVAPCIENACNNEREKKEHIPTDLVSLGILSGLETPNQDNKRRRIYTSF